MILCARLFARNGGVMKSLRKIISIMLLVILSCVNSSYVNAAKQRTNELECDVIARIANGFDEVVGEGVKLVDAPLMNLSDISVLYTSGGVDHTHQYIVAKAIAMLKHDQSINFFDGSIGTIVMQYSDQPDKDDVGTAFASHFWNPDNDKNFLGQKNGTAKTRFLDNYKSAVSNYCTNPELSYEYLGRALHYLSDVGEPHHASNQIAVLTNHGQYEKWVDENRTSFYAVSSDKYTVCTNYELAEVFKKLAVNSKSYSDLVKNKDKWTDVARGTVPMTQKYVAGILYRYLKDIGMIN